LLRTGSTCNVPATSGFLKTTELQQQRYELWSAPVSASWSKKGGPMAPSSTLAHRHQVSERQAARRRGARLREARQASGYPIDAVALAVGRSFDSMRSYECGRVTPPLDVFYALCQLYGLDVAELLEEVS